MDLISRRELSTLLASQDGLHVSIFMPTERRGAETQQNPIRLKNLLREAHGLLEEKGLANGGADELLAPARRLIDDFDFWQHQEDGLALFLTDGLVRSYRLPLRFTELAAVEDRFHLKSLFPLFNEEAHFYILALSQNRVRLFEGTRYEVHEVELGEVPQSLADALGYDLTESHLQFHTGTSAAGSGRAAIYHGQGAGEEDAKSEIRKFFSILDRGLHDFLDDRRAPLVLAGVDYLLPIYREATSYPNTLEDGVTGNPDALDPAELHPRAWALVEDRFRADRREAEERFGDLSGTGRAARELDEIVRAAIDGRVDTLWVATGVRRWGSFDEGSRRVDHHGEQTPESEDLLDLAAVHTYLNSGKVWAVGPGEVPGEGEAAAVYRY